MDLDLGNLLRRYGASTRAWAASGRHEVHEHSWLALSGARNVDFNLSCCWSPSVDVLMEECLEPILELGEPGFIILAGEGQSQAGTLINAGWVKVGEQPLMLLSPLLRRSPPRVNVRALSIEELPLARKILADSFALDAPGAVTALPNSVVESSGVVAWGLFEDGELLSTVTVVREDEFAVIWSMATQPNRQGRGYGRVLLEEVLRIQLDVGASGSLLASSKSGENLYRSVGYATTEHLHLWSRPRWVLGAG